MTKEKEFKLIDYIAEVYGVEVIEVNNIKECFRLLKESPDFDDEDKAFFNKLTGFEDKVKK